MYFHPWLPTVTPSQPISLPRPAPTCARTFGASENTASTWKNCRPRSVRSLCPSIFPCDNILHVSSGYPRQEVWKGRIGTDPMPGASKDFWGDALGDAKSQLALVNAIEAGLLRSREAIDEEIRERRNRWRGGSSGGPNKPPTGWD